AVWTRSERFAAHCAGCSRRSGKPSPGAPDEREGCPPQPEWGGHLGTGSQRVRRDWERFAPGRLVDLPDPPVSLESPCGRHQCNLPFLATGTSHGVAQRWCKNQPMASPVNPPRGMRDFLPAEKATRERVLAEIRRVYRAHGFDEI